MFRSTTPDQPMHHRAAALPSFGVPSNAFIAAAILLAVALILRRGQFGNPIADFQATQFTLADMETELQAARYLLLKVTEPVLLPLPVHPGIQGSARGV